MMSITAGFPIPIVAHSSHAMMQQLFRIMASTLSVVSIIAAVADGSLCGLLPFFFPPLLKWWTQHLTELISLSSLPHASQMSVSLSRSVAFCSHKFSHHSVPGMYILSSLHCVLLLCCMHMTETPTILVVLANVAIQWLRQETLLGITLEIDRGHYFYTNLHILKKWLVQVLTKMSSILTGFSCCILVSPGK